MGRFGAFLVHLGISLVIFAVLAYLVVYDWYPDFFFATDGGWQGMRIIIFVDLVLGPLLTLVVFNRAKPAIELRRDLSIVGLVQATCLAAGTYVVYTERPLALVYVDGRFFSMSADDYREAGVKTPELQTIPGPIPKRVVVELPEAIAEEAALREHAMAAGKPLRALTERYAPLSVEAMELEMEKLGPEWLETRDSSSGEISDWLQKHDGTLDDYAFVPYGARYAYLVAGVDRESGEIVGFLPNEYSTTGETLH